MLNLNLFAVTLLALALFIVVRFVAFTIGKMVDFSLRYMAWVHNKSVFPKTFTIGGFEIMWVAISLTYIIIYCLKM